MTPRSGSSVIASDHGIEEIEEIDDGIPDEAEAQKVKILNTANESGNHDLTYLLDV